jgi:two-component system OmpR family sensor kinase
MTSGPRNLAERARRATGSTRARILASYVVLLALAMAVSVVAIRGLLLARVDARVEENLLQETQEFRTLVGGRDPRTGQPFGADLKAIFDVFLSRNVPAEGEQIVTYLGERPYRTKAAPGTGSALHRDPELGRRWGTLTGPETGRTDTPSGPALYAALPIELGGRIKGRFVVASLVAGERAEVDDAIQVVGGVAVGVLLIGTVIAFVAAGRVLAPLGRLTETARQISETDLTRRIEVRGSDEIAEQARTFNAMLDRLKAAFESQGSLIRDVGHELRTPITIVRGNLEVLDEDDTPEERRETLALVESELDRITRLVDDLLILARAERPDFLALETVDLAALSEELLAKARQLGDRDWQLESKAGGRVVADRQRLTQAIMNLASNAVAQTDEGDRIVLGSSVRDGTGRLWVRDFGPGIDAGDQRRIFDRFARGSNDAYEGTGLGLAIVKAIAEAHGGAVRLDSRPGHGACFTVVLPMEAEGAAA